jgi:hypothetical protein
MRQGIDEIRRIIREQEPQTPSMFVCTMAFQLRTDVAPAFLRVSLFAQKQACQRHFKTSRTTRRSEAEGFPDAVTKG